LWPSLYRKRHWNSSVVFRAPPLKKISFLVFPFVFALYAIRFLLQAGAWLEGFRQY
jgi:hypothetical protein